MALPLALIPPAVLIFAAAAGRKKKKQLEDAAAGEADAEELVLEPEDVDDDEEEPDEVDEEEEEETEDPFADLRTDGELDLSKLDVPSVEEDEAEAAEAEEEEEEASPPPEGEEDLDDIEEEEDEADDLEPDTEEDEDELLEAATEAAEQVETETLPTTTTPEAAEQTMSVPDDTADMVQYLLRIEGQAGWKKQEPRVAAWQASRDLTPDGLFGPKTALAVAEEIGTVPLVRYWPRGSQPSTAVPEYKRELAIIAARKPEPHKSQLIKSAEREEGQGFGTGLDPVKNVITFAEDTITGTAPSLNGAVAGFPGQIDPSVPGWELMI